MRQFGFGVWIVPVAFSIAAVFPTTGWAAERCVLGELFTATW